MAPDSKVEIPPPDSAVLSTIVQEVKLDVPPLLK